MLLNSSVKVDRAQEILESLQIFLDGFLFRIMYVTRDTIASHSFEIIGSRAYFAHRTCKYDGWKFETYRNFMIMERTENSFM